MNPSIKVKKVTAIFLAWLACVALSPRAQALLPSPPPDGGYPNENTAEGNGALFSLTTGVWNTALGFKALTSNTIGRFNTATGDSALSSNTTGDFNTAVGTDALGSNTTGDGNTATGDAALADNTIGELNTATGVSALLHNTTGADNTATGLQALSCNTTGNDNTATGLLALNSNRTGDDNTATGVNALEANRTGNDNTAIGVQALGSNTTGNDNTATGLLALNFNQTGSNNTATGFRALQHNTSGSRNIALGFLAGGNLTNGSNNIDIGNQGVAGESGQIRIGTPGTQTGTFIAGVRGAAVEGALPVVVGSTGRLGTLPSSVRFKEAIKPMDRASEAILALKPVTFRYKNQQDTTPQFGLIAEDVAGVNPDLVVRDENGDIYTVRYDALNAMVLNEFLKEHKTVQEQGATIARLQKQIEALSLGLQKMSAQLEVSKPAPQVVNNPRAAASN
jgi:hypothetical protein